MLKQRGRPFTGARIETVGRSRPWAPQGSPLHGGADRNSMDCGTSRTSPVAPSRGRGSKPVGLNAGSTNDRSPLHGGADRNQLTRIVGGGTACRPFTGARIETLNKARELQLAHVAPSRGRGSKRQRRSTATLKVCRPFTGARIETDSHWRLHRVLGRRPFTGARIETAQSLTNGRSRTCRPFTGARIETIFCSGLDSFMRR